MTFNELFQDRLDKADGVDAKLAELVVAWRDYRAAVAATVAAAPRAQQARLADAKVDAQIVGTIATLAPHLVTKPGGLRSQADADRALLNELFPDALAGR